MPFNRIELKMDAKAKIKSAVPQPYFTTGIYLAVMIIIGGLNQTLNSRFESFTGGTSDPALGFLYGTTAASTSTPAAVFSTGTLFYSFVFLILLALVSNYISVGYSWFTLRISRRMTAVTQNLLDAFNLPFKVLGLSIIVSVFTLLWLCLFIVPGIIAAYRYRLVFYVLFDHPEYGIMKCISESSRLMRGRKWELFVLDISFIGWQLLSAFTFGILLIWTLPYIFVTYANFYNAINPDFVIGTSETFDV